jgi:hypothetical protein
MEQTELGAPRPGENRMSKRITLLGYLLFLLSCASSAPPGAGAAAGEPMGTGCDDLVVIDAPDTGAGIDAEYAWIQQHFPGFQKEGQSLGSCDETMVDMIEIVTADGTPRRIYFDISSFFGKL